MSRPLALVLLTAVCVASAAVWLLDLARRAACPCGGCNTP